MNLSLNLMTSIGSIFAALQPQTSSAPKQGTSTAPAAPAPQGGTAPAQTVAPSSSAPVSAATAAAVSGLSPATAVSAPTSAASNTAGSASVAASATASASVNVAGVASADVGASVSAGGSVPARGAALPPHPADADIQRHFAIGMQQSAGQFAAERLSQGGSDPSGAAAALDASEKRFKALVSQIAVSQIVVSHDAPAVEASSAPDGSSASAGGGGSGQGSGPDAGPSAPSGQVQKAYADA